MSEEKQVAKIIALPYIQLLPFCHKVIDWICGKLGCVPEKDKCKDCRLSKISGNASFAYEMQWFSLLRARALYLYQSRGEILEQVRKERNITERVRTTT